MPKESLPDEPQYSCRMRYPFPPFIRRNSLILNGFKCMSGLPFLRNNSGSPERGDIELVEREILRLLTIANGGL